MNDPAHPAPALLYSKVALPPAFTRPDASGRRIGGDLRIGDLTGDGQADLLVYNALGGIKPCFLGAFSLAGEPLWAMGDRDLTALDADSLGRLATIAPDRPGPVAICDIDQDGQQEVLCFLVDPHVKRTSKWNLADVHIAILNGRTGAVKRCTAPEELTRCNAYADGEMHIANYVHQRLVIANFSGHDQPRDFVVKLGSDILAFNDQLEPDVFRFLDFAPFIGPVDPAATQQHLGSLERLCAELIEPSGPQFKFLHFWYTHGGYGLGGIPHPPDLRQLVAAQGAAGGEAEILKDRLRALGYLD